MAVLMEIEFGATADQYDEVHSKLDVEGNPPDGLLIHTGEVRDGKIRVVDVWESREAFEKFNNDRLMAAVTEVIGEQDPDSGSPPQVRELHRVVNP